MKSIGKFIVFEGLDGSGQSTAAESLKDFLTGKGLSVFATKEPTLDSESGREIKRILRERIKINPLEFQKLFAEDRKEHLEKQIIPAIESGKIVLSDRYIFSTYAFGAADGAELDDLIELNKEFLYPDIIFLLKVDAKIAVERIENRGAAIELFEREEILRKVSEVYDTFPRRFKNFKIINAEMSKEKVFEEIKKYV